MVSLGFFEVAGQNDLPFVAYSGHSASNNVQNSLLAFSSTLAPSSGIRSASVHNRDLCQTCLNQFEYRSAALNKQPLVRDAAEVLAEASQVGLSTQPLVQAWLASPQGAITPLSECLSACADVPPQYNRYAGGYERPYASGRP